MSTVKKCTSAQELVQQHILTELTGQNFAILDRSVKGNHAFLLVKKDGECSIKFATYNRVGTTWNFKIVDEQEIQMNVACPAKIVERSQNQNPKAISWRKKVLKGTRVEI